MSENSSFNESEEEDEYQVKKSSQRVSLRQRNTVSYSEKNFEELDKELEEEISSRPTRAKKSQNNYKKIIQQNVDDELEEEYSPNQDQKKQKSDKMDIEKEYEVGQQEPGGIFYPEIDQILFRKEKENDPGQFTYLVKYKEWSYLHVDWLDEKEVIADSQPGKNKLNRFNKAFDKKIAEGEIDEEVLANERYFDPSYIEVDRILHTTELFPVIHPKKANEIKGKWTEVLVLVVNKLLNFSKDTVHYGIHFAEPVNPDRDGCPNYKKLIPNPMDLGSLLNRLYLDYYKSPQQVWVDVGLVFKNCRKFNKDEDSDIRILCDTLRECALYLYQQWHDRSKEKYEQMLHDYKMVYDEKYKCDKLIEYNAQFDKELKSEEYQKNLTAYQTVLEDFIKSKKDESQELQDQFSDYIDINKEKEGIKENVILFSEFYNASEAIKYQSLENLAKGFQLSEELQNLVIEISKTNEKQETTEEERKKQEALEEEEEKKQQELEKNLSKEQQKEVYEKKKQQYKSLISQLTSEQKQKLQSDLNQQYKTTLQSEVHSAQKSGQKLTQEEYQKLQIQIKSKIQNQQLDKIRQLKKLIEENQRNPIRSEKKGVMKSVEEIEKFNPGDYTYDWIQEERKKQISEEFQEGYRYIGDPEFHQLSLSTELDRLYLVKWKNLSYLESTWEQESLLGCPQKIYDFKMFNRALDKESRGIMMQNNNRHKTLLDLENNPKKKAKLGQQALNDIKNKLFFYDVSQRRGLKQYTKENQTIYKDRKLLRYYQLESLNWLVDAWYNKRNVILADEMGLGKTIQTMSFLNHLHVHENCRGPFLVIAPLSTLEHWKRTIETWTNLNGVLYYDTQSQDGRSCLRYYEWLYTDISTKGTVLQTSEIYKFTVLITSNEVFMQDHQNILMNIPFQFIAVDEAHRLKNQNAKILTALKKMPCKRVLLLTGTPIQNNTEELFTLLNFIEPSKFNNLDNFKDHFGELKTKDQIENLQKMLKPYLLRRMKEDVEDSIPPLQETIIDIEMTTVQKALYRGIYEKNKTMLAKNFSTLATGASLNNLEMQLRKCCSHPFLIKEIELDIDQQCHTVEQRYEQLINQSGKMILLDKLIMKFKKENTKVLIFSQFTYILSLIEEYLKYNKLKFEKIDGAVKARDRQNAIDRFNNPNKQRDVFLLSTKAGGLGINLTSANVVIIFDSDWNPQNDLQAIARAHRIGQTNEVMVYRFITRATYEAQMFERSTIKLGLDQAIFLGGEFKDAKGNDQKTMKSKMDNKEVEILLKKGILGFVDDTEDAKKSQQFQEENIDQILLNNTRQGNFSLVNGSYSFNKQAFVSKQTDVDINMDDPEFWNKILKGRDSQAQQLKDEFSQKQKEIESSLEQQKQFIWKLCDQINQLVESKLSGENYSADDERNINDILNTIISTKFHSKYQNLATNWLIECQRPTRRFRKMTLEDLELQNLSLSNNQLDKKGKKAISGIDLDGDDEENLLYDEDDDLFSDNNVMGDGAVAQRAAQNGGGTAATNFKAIPADKKLRASDDMLRKLCYYCERINCTFICSGPCRRGFHENCKNEIEKMGNYISLNGPPEKDVKLTEDGLTEEQLRKLINKNANYTCPDCKKNQVICFICKKKGPFFGNSKSKKKKKNVSQINIEEDVDIMDEEQDPKDTENKEETDQENQEEEKNQNNKGKSAQKLESENDRSELIKCSTANCNKFYHLSCTDQHKLFKYIDPPSNTRFRCSLHYCQKCSISGDSLTLAQCVRCHRSYHLKCFEKLEIKKLGKKVMICHRHDQSNAPSTNLLLNPSYNNTRKEKKKKEQELVVLSEESEGEEQNQNQGFSTSNLQNHNKIQLNIDNEDLDLGDFVIQKKKKDQREKERKDLNDKKYKKQKTEKGEVKKDRESRSDRDRDRERERDRDKKRTTRHSQTKLDSYYSKKHDSSDFSDGGELEIAKYLSKKKEDKKKDKKSSSSNNFTNKDTVPKYTYEQLGMPSPKNFDYTQYKQDWCRYCGARFSSNFTKGPWAPRTLCTVHYIYWMQKKKLNLSQYKDLPTKPINPDDLNELLYISREKSKNPNFNPGEELTRKLAESLNQEEEDLVQEEQDIQQAIEDQENEEKNKKEEGEAESSEEEEGEDKEKNNKKSEKKENSEKDIEKKDKKDQKEESEKKKDKKEDE